MGDLRECGAVAVEVCARGGLEGGVDWFGEGDGVEDC